MSLGVGIVFAPGVAWAANGLIQSQICEPFADTTITAPADGTQTGNSAVHVTGTAEPEIAVTVLRNGVGVGVAAAAIDGTYGLEVPLSGGDNSLVARSANSCGTTHDSSEVNIFRIVADDPSPAEEPEPTPPITSLPDEIPAVTQPVKETELQAQIPAPLKTPVITKPKTGSTTASQRLWVIGNAPSGSVVSVILNDKVVAQVTASSEGSFAALVGLADGSNTIRVVATRDGQSASSKVVTVSYAPSQNPVRRPEPEDSTLPAILIVGGGITLTGISLYGAVVGYHWIRPRLFKGLK